MKAMNFSSAGHMVTEMADGKVKEHFEERKKTEEEIREERIKNLPEFKESHVSLAETLDRNAERAAREAQEEMERDNPDMQRYPGLQFVNDDEMEHYKKIYDQKDAATHKRKLEEAEYMNEFKKARTQGTDSEPKIGFKVREEEKKKPQKSKLGALFAVKKKGDKSSSARPEGSPVSNGDAKKLSGLMGDDEPTPDGKKAVDLVDEKKKEEKVAAKSPAKPGIGGLMGGYGSDSEESGSEDSDDGKLPLPDLSGAEH